MKVLPLINFSNAKFNFKSNFSSTKSKLSKIGSLNHETYLFREPATDEYVQNYIRLNCEKTPKTFIVSGACSSGEEAMSYLIMLDDLAEKIEISAFDLDENVVSKAKNGIVSISHDSEEDFLFKNFTFSKFKQKCIRQFKRYFTSTGAMNLPKFYAYIDSMRVSNPIRYDREFKKHANIEYQFDEMMLKKIDFRVGDILKIDDIYKENSVDVLLFRNAMYHLLCENNDDDYRVEHLKAQEIADLAASKIYKVVKKGGLVVFGEKEYKQGIRCSTVKRAMQKNGFKPLDIGIHMNPILLRGYLESYYDGGKYYHVWQK